uniref:Cap-28 n=1 Tax=Haemonchus contortus TaxID=6289 RepID=A0A0K2DSY1_HAECO|nr:cap-28 [Haemonchus contortus]
MLIPIAIVYLVLFAPLSHADFCPPDNGMTDEVRDMFLKKHNEYRSQVARGLAKDRLGGTAPTAGKMARMSYDCKIEESMMRWLNQCKWGHSRGENGENMFMSTDTRMNKVNAADQSTKGWFSELETKGVGKENKLTMQVFNRGVGHYTQMVWQSSKKLGCGVKVCNNFVLAGCQYQRRGNLLGANIYDKGNTCSMCKCPQCRCDPREGLCDAPDSF